MADLLRQFFLNPTALLGGALISVPIIIYLINRQKYQRRKWAAMEFLLRAMKRNQRRIQVQNLLLLLIRTAVILFLVLAAARPVFRQSSLAITSDENQNWVLAIDTSYSMGYEEGGTSFFDESRQTVLQLIETFAKTGDRVALMTLADQPRVLLPPTAFSDESRAAIRRELEDLELSAESLDLGASLQALDTLCERFVSPVGDPELKRVVLFSDFQRKDWVDEEGPRDGTVLPTIQKIQREHGEFTLAHSGSRRDPLNLAVTSLDARPPLIAQDVWVEFRASVHNFGAETANNIDLSIRVDAEGEGAQAESQLGNVLSVAPGVTAAATLAYRFDRPGHHTVVAELRADGLVVDNRRFQVVQVEESFKVLLVDGEPAAESRERETFHLEVALQPNDDSLGGSGVFTPFRPEYVSFEQLGGVDLREYAVVLLANVPDVRAETAEALQRYVADGGALVVFLGDRVDPVAYNQSFGGGEGERFMPFVLREITGIPDFPVRLQADPGHPVGAYFAEHEEFSSLRLISFFKYYTMELTPGESEDGKQTVRVPFRYTDLERSPAFVDNSYGKGRVLWATTSADTEWNEFPVWPDFVVFLYESISYLVRFGADSLNLRVGEPFAKSYDASAYASEVVLQAPVASTEEFQETNTVRKDMRELVDGGEFEITHESTALPGFYRLDLLRPNRPQPDSTEYFAVNVNTSESDMRLMREEDFRADFADFDFQVFDASEDFREAAAQQGLARGREYWRVFLFGVLALLVTETILAYFFGRRVE